MEVFAPSSSFCQHVSCVRETEILVEQPPQGVFVCDHAGLVINKLSLYQEFDGQIDGQIREEKCSTWARKGRVEEGSGRREEGLVVRVRCRLLKVWMIEGSW